MRNMLAEWIKLVALSVAIQQMEHPPKNKQFFYFARMLLQHLHAHINIPFP